MTNLNADGVEAAVTAYDEARCHPARWAGVRAAEMSSVNRKTIEPLIEAAIQAYLSAASTARPEVKALEWNPFRAETPFGWYFIDDQRGYEMLDGREPYLLSGSRLDLSRHLTLEAARSAAQADYNQRILSALAPSPPPAADTKERK